VQFWTNCEQHQKARAHYHQTPEEHSHHTQTPKNNNQTPSDNNNKEKCEEHESPDLFLILYLKWCV